MGECGWGEGIFSSQRKRDQDSFWAHLSLYSHKRRGAIKVCPNGLEKIFLISFSPLKESVITTTTNSKDEFQYSRFSFSLY